LDGQAPFDVGAIPPYATVTSSGLATCVVRPGSGSIHPTPDDQVEVKYAGWTTDGMIFGTNEHRVPSRSPPRLPDMPGWTEGVGLMVEGEVRRLWIPERLANQGRAGHPAGMLVFDIELIRISQASP
jgi:FKBP-type peptidyl-prolyl cis-trans isomerase